MLLYNVKIKKNKSHHREREYRLWTIRIIGKEIVPMRDKDFLLEN